MNATDAQIRFLSAWLSSHPDELADVMLGQDLAGRTFDNLTGAEANGIISVMVATYGEPKKGDDSSENSQDEDGEGKQEGDGNTEGNADGEGEGEGDNQTEGEGEMENPYREGSKEQIIAEALIENDLDTGKAFDQIKDDVGTDPLEFKGNTGDGSRLPLPLGSHYDKASDATQYGRTKKTINDVRRALIKDNGGEGKATNGDGEGKGSGEGSGNGNGADARHELEILLGQINKAREICEKMNADGEPFDTIGMRPYVHAPKMFLAGIPRLAILDSMVMDWPKEVRRELNGGKNLPSFDHRKFNPAATVDQMPLEAIESHLYPLENKTGGRSPYLPAMIAMAQTGTPILQIGEKGTGKTTNAEHLAMALAEIHGREMPFGFASMTSGTSPGEFKGRITLEGFLPSQFQEIYENGGVFLFDELDAGDENLLTLLNSALANKQFVNQKGQIIKQHDHCYPVAAANTNGLGATSRYTGRNRLDAATLDRWAMGRIQVGFDQNLAEFIFWKGAKEASEVAV